MEYRHITAIWTAPDPQLPALRRPERNVGPKEDDLQYLNIIMPKRKKIALVAHDHKKSELLEWAKRHKDTLAMHELCATGTTGSMVEKETKLPVEKLRSGPLGGDLEIGAKISEGEIDVLVFFWDPLAAQPHDPDVRALLRIAVVWNIPVVSNTASADFLFSSPFMQGEYQRQVIDYEDRNRKEWPLKADAKPGLGLGLRGA